jgi:hypothetical protein
MSQDPTRRNEDEYFARQNAELLAQHRARLDAERAARTQAGEGLRCPRDGAAMFERSHHGVTIDVCPTAAASSSTAASWSCWRTSRTRRWAAPPDASSPSALGRPPTRPAPAPPR